MAGLVSLVWELGGLRLPPPRRGYLRVAPHPSTPGGGPGEGDKEYEVIEIFDHVWVFPSKVEGVYLRELRGSEPITVVLMASHEIRLPGDHVETIKNLLEGL
jgi:hypothetical protein